MANGSPSSAATAAAIVDSPTQLNSRANIWGFEKLGVEYLITVSTCGSLQEQIHRAAGSPINSTIVLGSARCLTSMIRRSARKEL